MALMKVATVHEVPAGQAKQVTVGNRQVALFNLDGTYYAIEDNCPHRGAPLSEGEVVGHEVTCPWHGARFDLNNGSHLCPPANRGVMAFKVQVVGEDIQIDL